MNQIEKPIGVLGAGPVGSILAANFARIGQRVVLIEAAAERREQIAKDGLSIVGKDTIFTRDVQLVESIERLGEQPLRALFICTKTWTLKTVLPELARVIRPETVVISFQNGIGPEDEVARFFPKEQVARGIVNYAGGVARETGAVSMQWFNPPNYLGPLSEATSPGLGALAEILNRAGLTTETIPENTMRKLAFYKTILNSALNALCAASGITMRQAMTYCHTRNLARTLIREGLTVAAAVGYNYGEDTMTQCMTYLDAGGDHLPSMWTDLKSRNPTEIEFINGKIVKIGTMFKHCDVDAHIFFTAAIITQEIRSGVRDPDDIPEYLRRF